MPGISQVRCESGKKANINETVGVVNFSPPTLMPSLLHRKLTSATQEKRNKVNGTRGKKRVLPI